ncbi:MAG TPA: hypothetical protein PK609_02275 [Candidatus Paceibacterota bacterium]|nr:hypothetical protein [Candidatus Paceibacterota bacterium]
MQALTELALAAMPWVVVVAILLLLFACIAIVFVIMDKFKAHDDELDARDQEAILDLKHRERS